MENYGSNACQMILRQSVSDTRSLRWSSTLCPSFEVVEYIVECVHTTDQKQLVEEIGLITLHILLVSYEHCSLNRTML